VAVGCSTKGVGSGLLISVSCVVVCLCLTSHVATQPQRPILVGGADNQDRHHSRHGSLAVPSSLAPLTPLQQDGALPLRVSTFTPCHSITNSPDALCHRPPARFNGSSNESLLYHRCPQLTKQEFGVWRVTVKDGMRGRDVTLAVKIATKLKHNGELNEQYDWVRSACVGAMEQGGLRSGGIVVKGWLLCCNGEY